MPFYLIQRGEVKSLIRLLQYDGVESFTKGRSVDEGVVAEVLTLPALQAFVDGGEEYLAQRANEVQERPSRRHSGTCGNLQRDDPTAPPGDFSKSKLITRTNSWSEEDSDHKLEEKPRQNKELREKVIWQQLQDVLDRICQRSTLSTNGRATNGHEEMIEGYLKSFDLDDDGRLSAQEFQASLRSLGGQGKTFGGREATKALADRFSGGKSGVSIIEIARWYDSCIDGEGTLSLAGRRGEINHGSSKGEREQEEKRGTRQTRTNVANARDQALQKAVRIAESRGTTLERTFARLDEDGDGFITLRQLLRGLDQMRVFEQVM